MLNGLEWRRAFGFFLWYGTTNANSISDALDFYEEAFEGGNAAYPLTASQRKNIPDLADDFFPSSDIYDILYMIIRLYKNRLIK